MAGIYIHIPFCKKACHYCNFHFSVTHNLLPKMVTAIVREMELRNNYIYEEIETIYFGGGTPSILKEEELLQLMHAVYKQFKISNKAEITLEANPDDITPDKLLIWKNAGINRLSIGIQSFFDEDLQWMNRAHNAQQAYNSLTQAIETGFNNISIDLIYGTPYLTNKQWLQNLEAVAALNIPHLSCYALTVEPGTALNKMIEQHKKENVDAEKQGQQFEMLMQWAQRNNYEHYEISNFAKPGLRSRHNSSYWQGKPYIGLGPSAHSYDGSSRQWNIANNALYIESINKNIIPFEKEELTSTQKINEYIMTALRTSEGIIKEKLLLLAGEKLTADIIKDTAKYVSQNFIISNNTSLTLTNKGKLFADGIAAGLFR